MSTVDMPKMLPAPRPGDPDPGIEAPPGMAWWAVHANVGPPVERRDEAGKVVESRQPTKMIGYKLGTGWR